jgi:hypothetical protein
MDFEKFTYFLEFLTYQEKSGCVVSKNGVKFGQIIPLFQHESPREARQEDLKTCE